MIFFTPVVKFNMNRDDTGEIVFFNPGKLYHEDFLNDFNMRCIGGTTLQRKIQYLCTRWIKLVEPSNMHEVLKSLLLTKERG